jgi:tetratricopeptide (TPR) repeat protein
VLYLEPPMLRMKVFTCVSAVLQALAARKPVVLVFEDLHWADAVSVDLLEAIFDLTARVPLLLVALFRPYHEDRSWRFHQRAAGDHAERYTPIALSPLPEEDARTLVAHLLHIEDLPERVRALILRKAEGNPFFVEEVIRSLLDAGIVIREGGHWRATREIETISVPDTLTGVISARLDRLAEGPRQVAQCAAVIGREFEYDVLHDVHSAAVEVPPALTELQQRELVREAQHRSYRFKHVLTQETAYGTILLSRRRELHRRTAECLARLEPDRVSEIASHFLEGRAPERALPYVVEAGDRATKAYATSTAIDWYRKAIPVLRTERDAALSRRAYEGLAKCLELTNDVDGAIAALEEMEAYARAEGDTPMLVSALNKRAFTVAMRRMQFQESAALLNEAETLARQHADAGGMVEMSTLRCMLCLPGGAFDMAIDSLGGSVDVARSLELDEHLVFSLSHLAATYAWQTEYDDAWIVAQEALAMARAQGNLLKLAELLGHPIPMVLLRNGDLAGALEALEEGIAVSQQVGDMIHYGGGLLFKGQLAYMGGQYEQAIGLMHEADGIFVMLGDYGMFFRPMMLASMATMYRDLGPEIFEASRPLHADLVAQWEPMLDATALIELGFGSLREGDVARAASLFERAHGTPSVSWLMERPRSLAGLAMTALMTGDMERAQARIAEAREFASQRKMRHMEPLIDFVAGQIAGAGGDMARALDLLANAEAAASALGMLPFLWQIQGAEAGMLAAVGRTDEAEEKRAAAMATIERIADTFSNQEWREAYLTTARGALLGAHGTADPVRA